MASPTDRSRLPFDQAFKAICSHPRMIADTLRGYAVRPNGPLDPRTVAALDFSTLEKLPAEWITEGFRRRQGDQVWRVRFRWAKDWADPAGYLLVLAEFQSSPAPDMALRIAGYAVELYRELTTAGVLRPGGARPPIFALVMYNGRRRWSTPVVLATPTAPVAGLPDEARDVAQDLAAFQLCLAGFVLDFQAHNKDDPRPGNAASLMIGLESVATIAELRRRLPALASLADQRLERTMLDWALLRLRVAGPTREEIMSMASLDEFSSRLAENVERWEAELRAEGAEQGRAEGVALQRTALMRQAALRFGSPASVLAPLLEGIEAPAKLAEIGEWLIVDSLDQLLVKVEAAAATEH